ncbi:MAG: beta-galactosidase [Acidobacteriota bacterium]
MHPQRAYVLAMGYGRGVYRGMGYLLNDKSERVAAPVTSEDFLGLRPERLAALRGDRCVYLNFDPSPGFWSSADGTSLIRNSAEYASRGATLLWVDMRDATIVPGEAPEAVVYFRNILRQRKGVTQQALVNLTLFSGSKPLATKEVQCDGGDTGTDVTFPLDHLSPGLYRIQAQYKDATGKAWQAYETGFWSQDKKLLHSGVALTSGKSTLLADGKPFLPVGTNYFSTDPYSRGYSDGNAYVWNRDFAEMERRGISFVRTGVWMNQANFINPLPDEVNERFLRGVEAYLLSAAAHHIQINFTLCAFDPQTVRRYPGETSLIRGPGTNPYTDPVAIRAEQNYFLSIVSRFKDVPFLSWDLINEPSFSNPEKLWIGNVPNADPTEMATWNKWLEKRYGTIQRLAQAWETTPGSLAEFGHIPLPKLRDLKLSRSGDTNQVRAFDYNLFAQDMFDNWTHQMVAVIRATGSKQLVDVGQDEGGVLNRLLDQFFGGAGVDFTVVHTYWHDDALLWDSIAAKRQGLPSFVGETGIQPVWRMDNGWRWDEVTGLGLMERKFALGFADGDTGALQWAWENGDTFGIKRSDGADKLWEDALSGVAQFARKAAPYAQHEQPPEVAIVLPQSLQLSVLNSYAVEAQQNAVRALYQYARGSAYAVGEYQIQLLGNPKLIIIPSPRTFSDHAWQAIMDKVRAGATLLISGRFDEGPHFHPTRRQDSVGINYTPGFLAERIAHVKWPGGSTGLIYGGEKTNYLERGVLPSGKTFMEQSVGAGRILYFALPIEMNDSLKAIGEIYSFALKTADVKPAYSTSCDDPGILICPSRYGSATLYVLTSEDATARSFSFRDGASGKEIQAPRA